MLVELWDGSKAVLRSGLLTTSSEGKVVLSVPLSDGKVVFRVLSVVLKRGLSTSLSKVLLNVLSIMVVAGSVELRVVLMVALRVVLALSSSC